MQLLSSVTLLTAALVATADAIPSFTGMLPREISELLEKRGHNLEERTGHHEFEEMAHQDDWAGFRLAGCDLDGVTLPRTGGGFPQVIP